MKIFFNIVLALIIFTTSMNAEEGHEGHDHGAHGGEGFYGHLELNIFADKITSVSSDGKYEELYSHSHAELGYGFGEGWSINSNTKLEGGPDGDAHAHGGYATPAGKDHGIDDHMLVLETLQLNYDSDNFSGYIGKFNPVVGFNYHNFPGMYGYQVIEAYQIKEKIGFGGILKNDTGYYGNHKLNLSTFFADTGPFSDSLFFERGHNSKEDSGVSNTEDFSSYAISYSGSNLSMFNNFFMEGLSYRFGFAEQAAGINDATDNSKYSASLMHKQDLSNDLTSKFIFERMHIDNKAGEAAHNRSHTTGGFGLYNKEWSFGTTYTYTDNDADEADEGHNGKVFQASIGYNIAPGMEINFGYKSQDLDDKENERLGINFKLSQGF